MRYKIDENKSLAVPEDAGHDLPYSWLNSEFLRRRCHVLSAVRENENTTQVHVNEKKAVILEHCNKSVINFSTGNTFRHQQFNYYSPFLLHAYVIC